MRCLLIAPNFYGFDTEIAAEIRDIVGSCVLVDEKPAYFSSAIQAVVQKFPVALYRRVFERYVARVVNIKGDFDIVFLIRGEHWTENDLILLRSRFSNARFIMYQWDASHNLPLLKEQLKYFDVAYTFSPCDAEKFGIRFLPLFYKNRWNVDAAMPREAQFKAAFVGTDHSDRLEVIERFLALNGLTRSNVFIHLFRTRKSYYYNKYIKRARGVASDSYCFEGRPLQEAEAIAIFEKSQAILDVNPGSQIGLSARTFEALALNKKLITTNISIENYDFYDRSNIFILDRRSPIVPPDFFDRPYNAVSNEIKGRYSSSSWVKGIICDSNCC